MNLLIFFLKSVLFVVLTFVFLVLFQYGPGNFVTNSQTEFGYWQSNVAGATPEN